ncbi:MAG: exodeoxyribonuclease VII small subunit [Haemophilus parahaemolyticus]|uniref:exodeoxyribonuclease VII small subunit n=1 Tax=Haemophilus parahaemolyticus TaxID=735 RepID=UPI0026ED90A3|nr:exodeoxyribonuclease VII small subunit [Haemophilus parahaemolyticus]MBS6009431.1 exodeoxyribonuclease VII small subunit [Haemophilus parahaemolyticus]
MAKKITPNFETTLKELESIVTHLESGDLPLEDALNEFENAVKLVQQGQEYLQKAEQRIQILLNKTPEAELTNY